MQLKNLDIHPNTGTGDGAGAYFVSTSGDAPELSETLPDFMGHPHSGNPDAGAYDYNPAAQP